MTAPRVLAWTSTTHLHYRLDATEHARRTRAGAGAITSLEDLQTLLQLPVGHPVPLQDLPEDHQERAHHLPTGSVEFPFGHITRLAVRPLAVNLAVVTGPPAKALEAATAFAPFCPRMVQLRRDPGPAYLTEADFYGVGVTIGTEQLLAPAPHRPRRHTPAGWAFTERVYTRVRQTPRAPTPVSAGWTP